MRRLTLVLALLVPCLLHAQQGEDGDRDAQLERLVRWTVFTSGIPDRRARREVVTRPAGEIDLGDQPWRCGYGRPRNALVSSSDWSVQRVLACQRGSATVSATASCTFNHGRFQEHAASLQLGTANEPGHVTVTLACERR
jgi:hypothetical protein